MMSVMVHLPCLAWSEDTLFGIHMGLLPPASSSVHSEALHCSEAVYESRAISAFD